MKEFSMAEQQRLSIYLKCSSDPFMIDISEISESKKHVIYEILIPYTNLVYRNPVIKIVSVPGLITPYFHDQQAFTLEFKEIEGNKVNISLHEDKFPIDSYEVINIEEE